VTGRELRRAGYLGCDVPPPRPGHEALVDRGRHRSSVFVGGRRRCPVTAAQPAGLRAHEQGSRADPLSRWTVSECER